MAGTDDARLPLGAAGRVAHTAVIGRLGEAALLGGKRRKRTLIGERTRAALAGRNHKGLSWATGQIPGKRPRSGVRLRSATPTGSRPMCCRPFDTIRRPEPELGRHRGGPE